MEKELARLGSSPMAMVPCVKELLIKDTLTTVPPRFVRSDLDPPFVSSDATTPQIPVVDFHKLTSPEFMDTELHKFHHACRDWGFFQLINHGVEDSVVEKVKLEVIEFFNLPMEEKKKLWQKSGEVEGFGQAFVRSEEQKLDWVDIFFMIILPTHLRNPNLFPKIPLQLREALEAYSTELNKLGMEIISSIEKALGMELNELNDIFEEFQLGMRMNYYPPCPQPDKAIGFAPHSDGVGFTILLQVNEIEGLQVKKDGMWVPVKPLPNAFLINIGAVLEIITNETYRSIEHRATVNSEKERFSIATFFNPTREKEIGPASSLVTPENPALFGRITVGDFYKGYFSRELRDKKFLEFLKNNRDGQSN